MIGHTMHALLFGTNIEQKSVAATKDNTGGGGAGGGGGTFGAIMKAASASGHQKHEKNIKK